MNSKLLYLPLMGIAVLAALPVQAEEGPWLIRARVLDMRVDNTNQDTPVALQSLGQVTAENKVFPEVDFSYFFSKNFAAELILTYPQAHTISLAGTPIGSLKHLPPTLTAQYHFLPDGDVRPYVGLGVNYTRFMNVNLLNGAVTTEKDSFGLAAQAGLDYRIAPAWFLNVDAKYVQIETKVKLAASDTTITKLKIDPWLLSLGVGYRF
jgi:outer membrane protein